MNRSIIVIALVLAAAFAASAASRDLFPRGDVFCFAFYSTRDADSKYALANGATAIGPFYEKQTLPLSNAIAWNTKLIYKVEPPSLAGLSHADFAAPGFVWPSDATISNEVAAIVNAVRTNACIAIWTIKPEELRYYYPAEMNCLRVIYNAIHANDPSNRPVCLYQQNNRTAAQLGLTMTNEDLCVKGTYVNVADKNTFVHNRIWARWSMQQAVDACRLYNTNAAPWITLWMAHDPTPEDFHLIPVWCRHDAYMGLIMGGKGISIWSGVRHRKGFSDRAFNAYFNGYLSVAEDLNGPLKLAPVFLFGTKTPVVAMTVTSGPEQLSLVYQRTTNTYPPITYLAASHAGTNYLFMVNSAEVPVSATFSGLPDASREDLFDGGSAPTPGGQFSITLPPLGVKAFRFADENAGGDKAPPQTARVVSSCLPSGGIPPRDFPTRWESQLSSHRKLAQMVSPIIGLLRRRFVFVSRAGFLFDLGNSK